MTFPMSRFIPWKMQMNNRMQKDSDFPRMTQFRVDNILDDFGSM